MKGRMAGRCEEKNGQCPHAVGPMRKAIAVAHNKDSTTDARTQNDRRSKEARGNEGRDNRRQNAAARDTKVSRPPDRPRHAQRFGRAHEFDRPRGVQKTPARVRALSRERRWLGGDVFARSDVAVPLTPKRVVLMIDVPTGSEEFGHGSWNVGLGRRFDLLQAGYRRRD